MQRDQPLTRLESAENSGFPWDVEFPGQYADEVTLRPPASFRQALGVEPIRVGIVEFRIMLFLASWPYHAFTRRQIADAVCTDSRTVEEASVDDHVAALREQLGVFHDYVQSVPHVGYRFKP
jgi:DNA-binding response OmpR family regulator